jgi:hypothetical protein
MGNLFCMGLILRNRPIPSPRAFHHPHHRLPAGVHMDVLDRDFLLAPLAAVAMECIE